MHDPIVTVRGGDASPAALLVRLAAAARVLAAGDDVAVVSLDAELSTQQAAHLLGVSRPQVVRMIERGDLPARLVGTHRRVAASEVVALRHRQEAARAAKRRAVTAHAEALLRRLEDAAANPSELPLHQRRGR